MLSKYVPRSKIELVANPDYRGFVWNFKSTGTAWDNQLVKEMSGKQMPQIGKVNIPQEAFLAALKIKDTD